MKDNTRNFLSKLSLLFVRLDWNDFGLKIWYLGVNFPTLFQKGIVFELQVGQQVLPK
tara:strand:- start:134 stop:304 length:171 start_codon:yes stop_codon:yes gene_type:complete